MISGIKYAVQHPRKAARYFIGRVPKSFTEARYSANYLRYRLTAKDYTEFYSKLQNEKIKTGHAYDWDSAAGRGQFEFLERNGLTSENTLLDIGCGDLRGGIHAIRYLNSGNYYGMDISDEALNRADTILNEYELKKKKPALVKNTDLTFSEFADEEFDYILAQSVFTHLPKKHVSECFQHISTVMHTESVFFATVHLGDEYFVSPSLTIEGSDDVAYSLELIKTLAGEAELQVRPVEYPEHPLDMDMLRIELA